MNPKKPIPDKTNLGNSAQLDKDLQQLEQIYGSLEHEEPPAMLDQAILNKARSASESHPIRPWNFGWMHATATAAVLVIGLTSVGTRLSRSWRTKSLPAISRSNLGASPRSRLSCRSSLRFSKRIRKRRVNSGIRRSGSSRTWSPNTASAASITACGGSSRPRDSTWVR